MEDAFKDAPLQLVSIKEDGYFEITVDGINFLSALKNRKVNINFYLINIKNVNNNNQLVINNLCDWSI